MGDSDSPLIVRVASPFGRRPPNFQFGGGLKPVYSSASRTEFNSEFWLLTPEFCLIKKETITVYTPDQDVNLLSELLNFSLIDKLREAQTRLKKSISYSPMLRFILIDEQKRRFITQRYCFLGRIDDWIDIGNQSTLQELVKNYVKHLGQESFFELH
ncbi:hypothetical protein NIES37_69660 (plasmid) [Tolypothrix tenuis PCC 7101]|uniref:Uncharacterized protein n=1 Tax=Tolypothrix tenuis PCC 7101 TaxID=231146 RepID=A0A1Z4NB50_9CYAN|nr:hypothetical protein NIES37_69660 [Tolypothrix tenuis PCC 7101]BAZ78124.1 hypothetical protein NIES50_67570 [Aulosira laxa NIES-50]